MTQPYGRLLHNPNNAHGQPWFWNVAARGNNEELARSSETYTNRRDCIACYDAVVGRNRIPMFEFPDGSTPKPVTA